MPGMADNAQIVTVSSNMMGPCPLCSQAATTMLDGTETPKFDDACNHLINVHGLKCLHVGQQTKNNAAAGDGSLCYFTVAVFGKSPHTKKRQPRKHFRIRIVSDENKGRYVGANYSPTLLDENPETLDNPEIRLGRTHALLTKPDMAYQYPEAKARSLQAE